MTDLQIIMLDSSIKSLMKVTSSKVIVEDPLFYYFKKQVSVHSYLNVLANTSTPDLALYHSVLHCHCTVPVRVEPRYQLPLLLVHWSYQERLIHWSYASAEMYADKCMGSQAAIVCTYKRNTFLKS